MAHNLWESFLIFKWKQNNNRSLGKTYAKQLLKAEIQKKKNYDVLTQHGIGLLLEQNIFFSLQK